MPKQLNVNLAFTADTAQAKRQIQELQRSLQDLSSNMAKNSGLSKMSDDILKAQQSVLKLNSILSSSLNTDTGRLDLSKFNQQLGSAGMSIQSLATDMNALGADGQKAFLNLANSIVTTQKPMVETNKLLDGMWTALKNTARWQLSSSLLHGFMGAIQGAYGYAQDLNKSLTDIAIVTGRSTDQMAEFAEQANRSAQALSVSTTAYTDAALIYYQQGLDDAAVKARTDVTMKLSNVTGQSAEEVSSYMTAIWNNFDDGSKSMEYYADVITALGAATASSSREIAGGMQQFAAVANTVGLSYEYAATALATIVAQTRQSESTVGNGLRTIFARFDSVKLGETLEDGVGLTKYTEALEKAGVEVLDQNGQLKEMDEILNAIGEKWSQMNNTQKTALAQTVGGVKQYTNLMALFDNWDQFQKNLSIAQGADGSLQEQADIYAQNWEAAQKRVKAAWQAIYQDLIDSNFFIGLLDSLEKVLKGIDLFIDSVGGIPGILSVVGVAVTGLFGDKILAGIQNAQQQLKVMTKVAKQESDYIVKQTMDALDKQIGLGNEDSANAARIQGLKEQVVLNHQLKTTIDELAVGKQHLTQQEQDFLNSLIETTEQLNQATVKAKEFEQTSSLAFAEAKGAIRDKFRDFAEVGTEGYQKFEQLMQGKTGEIDNIVKIQDAEKAQQAIEGLIDKYHDIGKEAGLTSAEIRKVIESHVNYIKSTKQVENAVANEAKQLAETKVQIEAVKLAKQNGLSVEEARKQAIDNINSELDKEAQKLREEAKATQESIDALLAKEPLTDEESKKLEELSNKYDIITRKIEENTQAKKVNNEVPITPENSEQTKNFNTGIYSPEFAQNLTNAITMVSRVTMAFNSLKSAWDAIKDPNLSGWEKFSRVTMSLGMALPILIPVFTKLLAISTANTIAMEKNTLATMENDLAKKVSFLTMQGFTEEEAKEWFALEASAIAKKKDAIATLEDGTAHAGLTAMIKANTLAIWDNIKAMAVWLIQHPEILAIAAAIGAVTLALKAAYNASPEGQLEAANKRLEEASQKAQEATDAYNELKSTLDEYKQAKEDINNIEDSDERRRAINEENEKILEMLNNTENWYDIIGDLKYDDNGLIALTDEQIKALENDKAREESLAKQLELQEKINANTANQKVEDSKYTGQKINVTSGGSGATTKYDDINYQAGVKTDETSKIMDIFAKNGLGVADVLTEEGKADIASALKDAGYDSNAINQIIPILQSIATDENSLKQFNQIQAEHLQTIATNDALEKQARQEQIGRAEADFNGEGSITSLTHYEEVQAKIAEEWEKLDEETKEQVRNGSITLGEAFGEAAQDIIRMRDEAKANEVAEHDKWKETNVNSISDQMTGIQEAGGNKDYIKAQLDSFSDEELKIAATLDLDKYKTMAELQADIDEVQHEMSSHAITVDINADDLTHFKGKTEDLEKEVENLSKYIQDNADDLEGMSSHLKDCKEEANKVAYSIIRFDDAIQDVTENYDDWSKALKNSKKDAQTAAKATQEMTKAYANLLDVDPSQIDAAFASAPENLDLMKQAIEGNEQAYNQLQQKLGEQILIDIDVDKSKWESDRAQIESDVRALTGMDLDRLEVGADLNDEDFLNELTHMVSMTGMSADQARAYLLTMGIDAEVVEDTSTAKNTKEDTAFDSHFEPTYGKYFGPIVDATGQIAGEVNGTYEAASLIVEPHKVQEDETKENTAFALKVTSAHKSAGGGVKHKNSSHSGGGGGGKKGGGGCFAAGTLVTLQGYNKNIEDIQVGDIVLSYNEKTKKNVFNKVLQRMVHIVKEKIYSLFIKNEELTVTGIHRFLITRNNKQEWIQASELQKGDLVLLANGTLQEISNISIEEKPLTVYNFEVSNTHNYYVGENQILAHNKGKKGGGGKGSSKKAKVEKPKEKKKNIKEEDRYHNIKEKIDDLNKSMDRLNKNKDRAYGKDRIKYMQEEINKTKEQIGLTKDYIKEIDKYRKVDRANLDKVLGKGWKDLNTGKLVGGLNLKNTDDLFDADGILKNYEELFNTIQDRFDQTATKTYNKAVDEYNKAVAKFNKDQDQDAFDKAKEKLDAAEEEYKNQEDIYKQQIDYLKKYEDTMNLWQEKQQERIDQMNELLDKELELTQHKIELRLEVADDEKSKLEWLYDNLGDSADRAADRIANLGQQARVANKNIDTYLHALTNELEDIKGWEGYTKAGTKVSLKNLIESGELDYDINDPDSILNAFQKINNYITQDWIGAELPMEKILEDFAKYRDGLMDEYSNLKEIADTVEEQLIDAFEEWNEKLDDNLSLFDHYDTVIDTYKEIADLLGSDALGFDPDLDMSYQRAKLSNQQQAARFAKDAYDEAINERIKAQERLNNATSEIERKAAEEYLKLCEETERERQEEFLARTRDALRQAQELFEKTIENNQKIYLKSLGGGTPNLGILQNQLDMNKELNDLYLDDYEKYKKLGDLQNNINKQLAKNPNVKVQGKLNDLLDDVNSKMAAGAEISEGEATILEKRLQLLQAEDQLMAARNAKSAVRMTRDNEGNFSYTYTADTSKIEEAQQNYADKFYDLLDYEKQYSQEVQDNILQAMQDFNDKAAEIMEDSTLSQAEKDYLLKQLEDQCKMKVKFYTDQMQIITDEMTRFKNDDWADMEQTLGRMLASDSDFETNFNETTLGKIAPAWNEAKDAMVDFVGAADTLVGDSINAMNQLLIDNETTMKLVDSSTEAFAENYTGLLQDVVDKSVAAAEAGESLIQTMSDSLNEVLDETKAYYEEYGKELDDLFDRINKVTDVINQFRANWNGEATYEVATTDTGRTGANPSTVSTSNPSEGVNNPTDRFTSTFAGQPVITNVSGTTLPNSTPAELVGDNSEWLNSVIDKAMIKYDSLLSMNKSQTVAGNNNVVINADFPNVESYEEIAKAFETLINSASQYANENNG